MKDRILAARMIVSERMVGAGEILLPCSSVVAQAAPVCINNSSQADSSYIPVDHWLYPAVLRLYSLGFCETKCIWGCDRRSRAADSPMLEQANDQMKSANADSSYKGKLKA